MGIRSTESIITRRTVWGSELIWRSGRSSIRSDTIPAMPAASSETDFLVIGAGVAGLRAAIELAPAGRVLVLAKREVTDSSTQYAQGGIAAALSDEDEISLHLQDTLA